MPTLTRTSPIFKASERDLGANLEPPSGGALPQRTVASVASPRNHFQRAESIGVQWVRRFLLPLRLVAAI